MCAMFKKRLCSGLFSVLLLFGLLFTGCNTTVDTDSDQTTSSATIATGDGADDQGGDNTDDQGGDNANSTTKKTTTKKTSHKTNGNQTAGQNTTKGTAANNQTSGNNGVQNSTTATYPDDYEPYYIANADGSFTDGNTGVTFLDDPCESITLSDKNCMLYERGRKVFVDRTHPDVFKDDARFRRNDATSASDWWFSYYLSAGISECAIVSYTQESDAGTLIQTFDVYVSADNSRWTKLDLSYNIKEDKNLGNGWFMRTYRVTGLSKSNKYLKVQFSAVEDGAEFYVPNIGRVRINDIYNMQEFDAYMSDNNIQITRQTTATTKATTKAPTTAHKHAYSTKKVTATCTRRGYTQYTCACGDTYKTDYVRVEHKYSNGKCTTCGKSVKETTGFSQYEVSYYWGPHGSNMINEGYWKAIAAAGFTSVPLENGITANNKIALTQMKKYGLTCSALWDSRIYGLTHSSTTPSTSEVENVVKAVVADYAAYDNIVGWWLYDEPGSDKFDVLGKITAAFKKYDPNREVFVDALPVYADASTQLKTSNYDEYLNRYLNEIKPTYLCYDHYHFMASGTHRKQFFENFELVRQKSLAKNMDYMSIVLLTKHWNFADLTKSQLLWETNMCLAYGAKRMSYFTFILDQDLLDEGWSNACMNGTNGTYYQHYYDIQAINKQVTPLGRELFNKKSVAVYHLTNSASSLEKGCKAYTSYGDLEKVSGDEFVLGFFDDGSFMVANKRFQESSLGKNKLTFLTIKGGLKYFDTATSQWKDYTKRDGNGNYIYEPNGGEAMLFRVG